MHKYKSSTIGASLLLITLFLSACGQKGQLYLSADKSGEQQFGGQSASGLGELRGRVSQAEKLEERVSNKELGVDTRTDKKQ